MNPFETFVINTLEVDVKKDEVKSNIVQGDMTQYAIYKSHKITFNVVPVEDCNDKNCSCK